MIKMTEQELLQEALKWREHISMLANYYNDQESFRKRLATIEWLIKQAERVQELEKELDEALDIGLKMEGEAIEWERKAKRYEQALEYIQREIHKAIYTPKKQKWNSDFEREFESGKTRGLIRASDIVKEAIEKLEGKE